MTGSFTEFFKAASPLRGGYPGRSLAGGTWGATSIGDTISISTTLASCVMFVTQVYSIMPASGAVVTLTSGPLVGITSPAVCSGSWIAMGY